MKQHSFTLRSVARKLHWLPLGLLFWLPKKTAPARTSVLLAIILWLLAYGVLTFLCIQRI